MLIIGADKFNPEITPTHLFMNKMVFNFDVLSACVANAKTLWHQRETPPKGKSLKKHVQPTNFSGNGGKNSIFSLGGMLQDCRLWHTRQLGILVACNRFLILRVICLLHRCWQTMKDMAKINDVACNRFSILRVTCLLCIVVGKQWKRAYSEMKVMVPRRYCNSIRYLVPLSWRLILVHNTSQRKHECWYG